MEMNKKEIISEFATLVSRSKTVANLNEQKNIFVKKHLSPLYIVLKNAKNEDKKSIGQGINNIKVEIERMFDLAKERLEEISDNADNVVDYDINIDCIDLAKGSLHLLEVVQNDIINFFKQLNFDIVDGEEVVTINDNFDALNIAPAHPARQSHDSFYTEKFNKMLRTHCTANTSQKIRNKNEEVKVVSFGNVFRNDDDDLTHSHQFKQIDFVWIKEGLSILNLKWIIEQLLKHLFGDNVHARFRLSYFPFTEPSFEVDVSCFNCQGKGCSICKKTGYIEVLGAGMLHQNVLDIANISFCKTALAAGIGVDRVTMLKYKIKDIRSLYNNDFRLVEQVRKVKK